MTDSIANRNKLGTSQTRSIYGFQVWIDEFNSDFETVLNLSLTEHLPSNQLAS